MGNHKKVAKELNEALADVLPYGSKVNLDIGDWEQVLGEAIRVIRYEYEKAYDGKVFPEHRRELMRDSYEFVRSDFGNLDWLCKLNHEGEKPYGGLSPDLG